LVLMEQQCVTSSWYNRYLATDDTASSTQLLIQRLLWNSWKNIVYPAAAKKDT